MRKRLEGAGDGVFDTHLGRGWAGCALGAAALVLLSACRPTEPTPEPSCDEACAAVELCSLSGQVVDESGAAFEGASVFVCAVVAGSDVLRCLQPPAQTDATGRYEYDMPEGFTCVDEASIRVAGPSGGNTAPLYCPVDLTDAPGVESDSVTLPDLPAATVPPLGDGTQPHVVVGADGFELTVVPDELGGFIASYDGLRIRAYGSGDPTPCFVDPPADQLYAFGPEATCNQPGGCAFSAPAWAGLEPGASVGLYVLGGLYGLELDPPLMEDEWVRFGSATVSADGARVESEPGAGLPALTWLGLVAE